MADEADHYLSVVSRNKGYEALVLAESYDFERVKYRYLETLSINEELPRPSKSKLVWAKHIRPIFDYSARAPLAFLLYNRTSPRIESVFFYRIQGFILLLTAMTFILAFGKHLKIQRWLLGGSILWGFVCAPIAYYASSVTNYGILAILSYTYFVSVFFTFLSPRKATTSLLTGFFLSSLALGIYACSVNGIFILLFHTVFMILYCYCRSQKLLLDRIGVSRFFFLTPVIAFFIFSPHIVYFQSDGLLLDVYSKLVTLIYPDKLVQSKTFIVSYIGWFRALVFSMPFVGLHILELIPRSRGRAKSIYLPFFRFLNRIFIVFLAILGSISLAFELKMPFVIQGYELGAAHTSVFYRTGTYILTTLVQFVRGLVGGVPDFMAVQSYWGGFGWLDMSLPLGTVQLTMLSMLLGGFCLTVKATT